MLLLLILPLLTLAADPLDQVAKQGAEIFSRSRLVGQTVRQCSCSEQKECTEEMKQQAKLCTGPCFAKFGSITDRTDDLRKCFDQKGALLENFIDCFEHRVEGCVEHNHGEMIPKTDISAIFKISEKRIVHQTETMQTLIAPIKHVIDAAGEFAMCVKNCFLEKNGSGYCFDRKNCQPLIREQKAKSSFRTCTRKMNWKREAGELCDCSVDAGVSELKQYCTMFTLMGRHRHPKGNH